MTARGVDVRRRPAFIRYALVLGQVAFAAYVGRATSCDDRLPGLALLPAMALQLAIGVVSFRCAVMALVRRDRRKALSELGVGVLMLLAIPAAGTVFVSLNARGCQ